jgi:hypothetical protein
MSRIAVFADLVGISSEFSAADHNVATRTPPGGDFAGMTHQRREGTTTRRAVSGRLCTPNAPPSPRISQISTMRSGHIRHPCEVWVIEDVVAHLTAAASIGPLRWFAGVFGARLDVDLHIDRRLAEHRGATPVETLERFRNIVTRHCIAARAHRLMAGRGTSRAAQDIRRPIGLVRMPAWRRSK